MRRARTETLRNQGFVLRKNRLFGGKMKFLKRLVIMSGERDKGTLAMERNAYGVFVKFCRYGGKSSLPADLVMKIDGKTHSQRVESGKETFSLTAEGDLEIIHAALFEGGQLLMYGTNDPKRLTYSEIEALKKHIKSEIKLLPEKPEAKYLKEEYFDDALAESNYYPSEISDPMQRLQTIKISSGLYSNGKNDYKIAAREVASTGAAAKMPETNSVKVQKSLKNSGVAGRKTAQQMRYESSFQEKASEFDKAEELSRPIKPQQMGASQISKPQQMGVSQISKTQQQAAQRSDGKTKQMESSQTGKSQQQATSYLQSPSLMESSYLLRAFGAIKPDGQNYSNQQEQKNHNDADNNFQAGRNNGQNFQQGNGRWKGNRQSSVNQSSNQNNLMQNHQNNNQYRNQRGRQNNNNFSAEQGWQGSQNESRAISQNEYMDSNQKSNWQSNQNEYIHGNQNDYISSNQNANWQESQNESMQKNNYIDEQQKESYPQSNQSNQTNPRQNIGRNSQSNRNGNNQSRSFEMNSNQASFQKVPPLHQDPQDIASKIITESQQQTEGELILENDAAELMGNDIPIFRVEAISTQGIKGRSGTFFERNSDEIDKLFEGEREKTLENLLPNSKWAKIAFDGSGKYYVVGLLGKEYLCYGVPSAYSSQPPEELAGYCWWLPILPEKPKEKGYWIMYQNLASGETIVPPKK
jgi:hypothetical protein